MIFLRLACVLAGMLVLVAPPVVLFPNGLATPDLFRSAVLPVALLLAASSFFFIGIAGHRIKRSPALCRLSGLLLFVPFLVGAATLWSSAEPAALWLSGALLGFTLIVALVLALLVLQEPSPSRMRAREVRQSRLPVVHYL